MKRRSAGAIWFYQALWLFLLVVGVAGIDLYLHDTLREPTTTWVCVVIQITAWVNAFVAWLRYRRCRRLSHVLALIGIYPVWPWLVAYVVSTVFWL